MISAACPYPQPTGLRWAACNRRLMATLEELGAVYAIAHNQAQTVVLGANQLTTGCSARWNASRKIVRRGRTRAAAAIGVV